VGSRSCLDAVVQKESPCLCQESNLSHPVGSLVTILTVNYRMVAKI